MLSSFPNKSRFSAVSVALWMSFSLAGCGVISFSLDPPSDDGIKKTAVIGSAISADSLTVIAGSEYEAGSFHKWLWGEHYRTEWTTPFTVVVLDLGSYANGLVPLKRGGGFQTKSLRFQGNNGKQYAFRSINKDPTKALPPELRDTFAGGVIQDQISSSHPAAPLVADALADALGVIHPKPVICILPDDERLKEFRPDFAGILGMLEEYPADGPDGAPGFAGSTKIINTLKLFDELEKNSDDRVNASAYLTARLLDILMGDWDRHIDQWRWAKFEEEGKDVWYPIPRDRDQAFAKLDGLIPSIGAEAITQVEGFGGDYPKIADLTYSGRYTDRRILVGLTKSVWDSVTGSTIAKLTDQVLQNAVARIPEPLRQDNEWIVRNLKSRRDKLAAASEEYYNGLAEYVDIHLSDKNEFVKIERMDDEHTLVAAYRKDKDSGEPKGNPVYQRTFFIDETKEIRIYMHGGDDKALVSGEVNCGIKVRIVGGGGDDTFVDNSRVNGILWGFIPVPTSTTATYFYDDAGQNSFTKGPGTRVDTDKFTTTIRATQQY